MRCLSCEQELLVASRFCPNCAAPLNVSAIPTVGEVERKPPSSSTTDEGRFPAGAILGERFKILGLLGRGGMGEVYRAYDLKLEQQIALKFLPPATARDPRVRERFRSEVRIARQISHRNVCRVYDLGEIEGMPFISMEYVDGENLASLLRRIGRLPADKAMDFSRRLCAGLAAAHEKGVLHRDLKPANIMIDGRGQVLIMDFGLAAVAGAISGGDIRSGTPAYMAPEQKAGREVTVRSDVYSLGLVLAEMFTGEKASRDGKISTAFKDLDPAVEKVIQRCLETNPSKRPSSALDLARGLPGGDPLAEALAAGDTPSPQMVAASEETGVLSVHSAVTYLAFIVAATAALVFWGSRSTTLNLTPMPYGLEVLEQKSRELIAGLGYPAPPLDVYRRFDYDVGYQSWALRTLVPAEHRTYLSQSEPPEVIFFHLQSPDYLDPQNAAGMITPTDPGRPPGAVELWLDTGGRLRFLQAVPQDESSPGTAAFDWNRLFEAAGLDPSKWIPADPQETPPTAFDARAAWTGTYPNAPQVPLRIEAAAWRGRPVTFKILGPWSGLPGPTPDVRGTSPAFAATLIIAFLLALRNLRSGRCDLSGALRLALFLLTCGVIGHSLAQTLWQSYMRVVLGRFLTNVSDSFRFAAIGWVLYMAIEPYVRRNWPQALISWSRVLAGRFRDPLVGGHVLVGIAAGLAVQIVLSATGRVAATRIAALGGLDVIGRWSTDLMMPPITALTAFFVFVVLRLLLRRTWLAIGVFLAAVAAASLIGANPSAAAVAAPIALVVLGLIISFRFGMLALAAQLSSNILFYPVTANFSAWYAPAGLLEVAGILAVSFFCFRNALSGRKVWQSSFLET
jgi:predicted Ser/Thr protein kinase